MAKKSLSHVEVKAKITLEEKVKDVDNFLKKQAKNTRRKFCEEVVRETYSLLDFSIEKYKPDYTDYRTFLENFSETILQRIEPEICIHNSKKICAFVRGLIGIEETKDYKILEARASRIETQEAYEVFLKDAEELADNEIKRRYGELEKTIKAIKKGNKKVMSEIQISKEFLGYQLGAITNRIKEGKAESLFNEKRKTKIKDASNFLKKKTAEFLKEKLPEEITSYFLKENCINRNGYLKLRNETFEYKINPKNINFKKVYSKVLKLKQEKNPKTAVKNFINDVVMSVIIKNNEKQAGEKEENRKDTGNKILDYSKRTEQLDTILNKLTRDYCAKNCYRGEIGCCESDHYGEGMPEALLAIQEIESLKNKWHDRKGGECKYHNSDGCRLTLFKPTLCIGHFCGYLREYLNLKFGDRRTEKFLNEMSNVGNSRLCYSYINDRERKEFEKQQLEKLFSAMDKAIVAGKKLVESKRQK